MATFKVYFGAYTEETPAVVFVPRIIRYVYTPAILLVPLAGWFVL